MQLIQGSAIYDQQNSYIHDSLCLKYILNSYCAHQPHGDYSRSPELQIKNSAFKTMKVNSQEGHHSPLSPYRCAGTGRVETHVCT